MTAAGVDLVPFYQCAVHSVGFDRLIEIDGVAGVGVAAIHKIGIDRVGRNTTAESALQQCIATNVVAVGVRVDDGLNVAGRDVRLRQQFERFLDVAAEAGVDQYRATRRQQHAVCAGQRPSKELEPGERRHVSEYDRRKLDRPLPVVDCCVSPDSCCLEFVLMTVPGSPLRSVFRRDNSQ